MIESLKISDLQYPKRFTSLLGKSAPKDLNYSGNPKLLEMPAVGFCGSRHASPKGLETASDCAAQVARAGLVVVSGYASGVDLKAHYAALENGGSTILVLPEGINHFRIKRELKPVWDWSRVLVLSQFPNDAIWQSYRAMNRNQLIVALSQALIVIEAGESGGTMNAAQTAIRLNVPLFVATYSEMQSHAQGNALLIKNGAKVLFKSQKTGQAKIKPVLEKMSESFDSSYGQLELV